MSELKNIRADLDRTGERLSDLYDESAQANASPENGILYQLIPTIANLADVVTRLAALEDKHE